MAYLSPMLCGIFREPSATNGIHISVDCSIPLSICLSLSIDLSIYLSMYRCMYRHVSISITAVASFFLLFVFGVLFVVGLCLLVSRDLIGG